MTFQSGWTKCRVRAMSSIYLTVAQMVGATTTATILKMLALSALVRVECVTDYLPHCCNAPVSCIMCGSLFTDQSCYSTRTLNAN